MLISVGLGFCGFDLLRAVVCWVGWWVLLLQIEFAVVVAMVLWLLVSVVGLL